MKPSGRDEATQPKKSKHDQIQQEMVRSMYRGAFATGDGKQSTQAGGEAEKAVRAARRLLKRARLAALATSLVRGGWPYASLVTVAADADGSPILLLSDLADHTKNLAGDPRASLLIDEAEGLANPQTAERLTVMGRLKRSDDPSLRRRFLSMHPKARLYADFGDFHFYRMTVTRAHYVGGFGRALWIPGPQIAVRRRAPKKSSKSAKKS